MTEKIFQFALSNAQEMVVFFGKDGNICFANKAAERAFDYGEQLCNYTICDIFPNEFEKVGEGFLPHVSLNGDVHEMNAYRLNRTCFPVSSRFMVYDHDMETVYCCMAVDAFDKVYLEKQLAKSNEEAGAADKVKSEFIANVTHELRTPVNGILGNTRELAEMEEDIEKKRRLALIQRGCADMNAIINNILDFSKLVSGKFVLEKRQFNFKEMIDYVVSNHKNRINEKGIKFQASISPDVPEFLIGDELRIVQILNNLFSNAYKFTSVGKIALEVIRTAQRQNQVELFFLIMDTGIGIDKEGIDKLFQSFSQIDASISRKYGGTGLGLSISKQLVELMNGDIHVQSEPGKGSVFSFHIWVEIPQEELERSTPIIGYVNSNPQASLMQMGEEVEQMHIYGTAENLEEIRKKASKLILAVEMDNWEKAETFVETIKQLCEGAPKEVKSAALRLKMAVQKGDYDKITTTFHKFKSFFEN